MRISVISNNYSSCDIKSEHGLSLYVEFNNKKILIDSGLSNLYIKNAKQMGIDLSQVDYIILTHAHYDHTDGLPFFQFNGQKIFTHKYQREKYRLQPDGYHFNGIKWNKSDLTGECSIIENESFIQIEKGIYLSGSIPRPNATPKNNFFIKSNNEFLPDNIIDEQIIIFEQTDGLIVVSGCTHFGIENMTMFLENKFPRKKVKALFAGLHLSKLDDKELDNVIDYFSKCDLYKKIYALHCTGEKAGRLIEKKLNGKFVSVGESFEF